MTRLFTRFGLDAGIDVEIAEGGFAWDDYDPYEVIEDSLDVTAEDFAPISATGHILYSTACTELLIQLLYPHWQDDRMLYYMDALWSALLSEDFAPPEELDHDKFEGPLRGMVGMAFLNTLNTWYGADEDSSALDAAFSYSCVQHVLGDSRSFREWTDMVIARLTEALPDAPPERTIEGPDPGDDDAEEDEDAEEVPTGIDAVSPAPLELLCPGPMPAQADWPECCARSVSVLVLTDNPFAVPLNDEDDGSTG